MKEQVLVIGFACILSCIVIGLTIKTFLAGAKYLKEETEADYMGLFYKVKWINLVGVMAMCGAFITAAAVSEKHITATLALLMLVILAILIPKIVIQMIWRCPHCGGSLALGVNRGINVKLVGQCPACKKILCQALNDTQSKR